MLAVTLLLSACASTFLVRDQPYELHSQFVDMARSAEGQANANQSGDLCQFWTERLDWAVHQRKTLGPDGRLTDFEEFGRWLEAKWKDACHPCGRHYRWKRDYECAATEICSNPLSGVCLSRDQVDARCRNSAECTRLGHCTAVAGGCGVGSDADCLKSLACVEDGLCHFSNFDPMTQTMRPTCIADSGGDGSPDYCRKSNGCRKFGRCSYFGSQCVATGRADCVNSESCKKNGECQFEADGGYCRRPIRNDSTTSGTRRTRLGEQERAEEGQERNKTVASASVQTKDRTGPSSTRARPVSENPMQPHEPSNNVAIGLLSQLAKAADACQKLKTATRTWAQTKATADLTAEDLMTTVWALTGMNPDQIKPQYKKLSEMNIVKLNRAGRTQFNDAVKSALLETVYVPAECRKQISDTALKVVKRCKEVASDSTGWVRTSAPVCGTD